MPPPLWGWFFCFISIEFNPEIQYIWYRFKSNPMNNRPQTIFLLVFVLSALSLSAQNVDSLKNSLSHAEGPYDKAKINLIIANSLEGSDIYRAKIHANMAIELLLDQKGDSVLSLRSDANNTLGICESNQGNYDAAVNYFFKAAQIDKQLKALDKAAKKYVNIAIIYKNQGEHFKALQLYDSSMVQASEFQDTSFMASILLNKGVLYYDLGNYDEALKYYLEAEEYLQKIQEAENLAILKYNMGLIFHEQENLDLAATQFKAAQALFDSLGNRYGMAYCYTSLGDIYRTSASYFEAIDYYNQAYRIHESLSNKQGMAEALIQIGLVYFENGKFSKAFDFYQEAYRINQQIAYPKGQAIALRNQAHVFRERKDLMQAIDHYRRALNIAKELQDDAMQRDVNFDLSKAYEMEDNTELAFYHYKKYIDFRDTIETAELDAGMSRLKARHDIETREKTIENLQVKQKVQEVENQRQRALIRFSLIVLVIIVLFLLVLFRKNYQIRKINEELLRKQDLINSSISYASKIQAAVLPPLRLIENLLPNSFIFFRPRDIVSGDFYWTAERGGKIAVAAVDCTGHGVPGAFMSMMGISFLNEVFMKEKFRSSGEILSLLRSYVKEALHQTEDHPETKDGMDISLVLIDKEKQELQYSGAYSPLVIVNGQELVYLKGDRMPIGIHHNEKEHFSTHKISYQGGEMIYLFSDGYADQFGGAKGKKFRMSPFRELLQSISLLPLDSQKSILQQELEEWQGQHEQIDDILVMGIRLQ
jgi:serine phosphatase RsbU (regulator of sigma subunit)/Tfp pilus assembly protein PilF